MKLSAISIAIAVVVPLAFAGTAAARQDANAESAFITQQDNAVTLLSRATGLTEQQIEVELGKQDRWADNVLTCDFADDRFRKQVGYQVYYDLKTQQALSREDVQHLLAMATQRQSEPVALVK